MRKKTKVGWTNGQLMKIDPQVSNNELRNKSTKARVRELRNPL